MFNIKISKNKLKKMEVDLKEKESVIIDLKQQLKQEKELNEIMSYTLEKYSQEVKVLQKQNQAKDLLLKRSPKLLTELNISEYMTQMAKRAWEGKNSELKIKTINGTVILKFCGHIYEPCYENFSSTCAVYGYENGQRIILFDETSHSAGQYRKKVERTGSIDQITEYLRNHNQYVTFEDETS